MAALVIFERLDVIEDLIVMQNKRNQVLKR
jgi:hypothetical protein